MANNIDAQMYPDNDDRIRCVAVLDGDNPTTGAEELDQPLSGLTMKLYVSLLEDAADDGDAIDPALVVSLTEAGTTGIYLGSLAGSAKRAQMTAVADGTVVFVHFQAGTTYHEVAQTIWRTSRTAA